VSLGTHHYRAPRRGILCIIRGESENSHGFVGRHVSAAYWVGSDFAGHSTLLNTVGFRNSYLERGVFPNPQSRDRLTSLRIGYTHSRSHRWHSRRWHIQRRDIHVFVARGAHALFPAAATGIAEKMSPVIPYWQQYTDGVEPSLLSFPETTDTHKAPLSELIVLPALQPELVRDANLLVKLGAAWGLVLSFYCGSQCVCFGIQDRRATHVSTTLCRMNADPTSTLDAWETKLQQDLARGAQSSCRTFRDVLAAAGRTGSERLCNTAIVVCEFDPQETCFDACEVRQTFDPISTLP
jgi:hypothetical protein